MATFEVKVKKVRIEPHPDADRLELAYIDGYVSIIGKGEFKTGDLVAYIPEQSVVPDRIIEEMGLTGRLAGSKHNRVKAIRLRGVFSQGLAYSARERWFEGDDVTEELGIVKYEPPIPIHMSGEVYNVGSQFTINYDIESWKKYPDVIHEDELVSMTEKIHGTFVMYGFMPDSNGYHHRESYEGRFFAGSKGLSARGLVFKWNDRNTQNVYLRAARGAKVYEKMKSVFNDTIEPILLLGEVFGKGVQDLCYGKVNGIGVRFFDLCIGEAGRYVFVDDKKLSTYLNDMGLKKVPDLYRGPFSIDIMNKMTEGNEIVSGKEFNIREGVVIKPRKERSHIQLGRVILKILGEKYLLRKGGTEHN